MPFAAGSLLGIPGLTPGGIGIWTGVFMLATWFVRGWLTNRPAMKRLQNEQAGEERKERREEKSEERKRIEAIEARLDAEERRSHKLELSLVAALGAYRIIAAELQRISPDSAALLQAQALLSVAYPINSDMPMHMVDLLKPVTDKP